MGLMQGWIGAIVVGLGLLVAAAAWWWPRRSRRANGRSVPAAALDRVRRLPAFQSLVRRETRARTLEAVCLLVAVAGAALLGARLVGVGDDDDQLRSRDIILCLDVSGSMREVDTTVIDTYLELVAELRGERIGFVMFDATAVTGFPLTSDYEYIVEQLGAARVELDGNQQIAGTTAPRVGSSLIGDGLASCVQRFDHAELQRSRTTLLPTDNLPSRYSIYTLAEAAELAGSRQIMVYGIMPETVDPLPMTELREQVRRTNGDALMVTPGEPTNTVVIREAVQAQQKAALIVERPEHSFDLLWPGTILLLLGLLGSGAAEARRPR
ncbi:MAG: VWA domain-containing protein [Propionibacteriaceae bacterium]|nr:VWA domain-containing protein [Propionibacteriaceae bacterium]